MYHPFRNLMYLAIFGFVQVLSAQVSDQSLEILKQQLDKESDPTKRIETTLVLAEKMLAQGQVADADHFAELAANDAQGVKNKIKYASALDLRGEVCRARFDYSNALMWYAEAQKVREIEKDQRGLAQSSFLTGQVLLDQKETEKALDHLKHALELYTSESNLTGQAQANKLLGELFLQKQVFGSAQEHIKTAIDQYVELGDHASAAQLANRLGKFAYEIGDSEGALVYMRQSFNLHVGSEDKHGMANDFLDMGKVLKASQANEEAASQIETGLQLFTELNDTVGMVESILALANIAGNTKTASLLTAKSLLSQVSLSAKIPDLHKQLSSAWSAVGNTPEAYQALSNFVRTDEQMGELNKQKALVELDMRYQSEIAESTRRRTIERLEMEQTSAHRIKWALLGLLAFGALALWSVWNNYKLKKRDNVLLQEKNLEIKQVNEYINIANCRLDETNQKLVHEIAEREMLESNVFEKDKFLAIVSREMKQPLQQIIRATTQLAEGGPKQITHAELNEMQFSANNLLVFINDMLDYNNIETGKLQLESNQFDPSATFNEIRERFASQYREQGITFRMEYDSALPTQLSGDQVRLNQVVSKLLQYLPVQPDKKTVTLAIMHGPRERGVLELQIKLAGLDTNSLVNLDALHGAKDESFMLGDEELRSRTFSLAMVMRLIELQEGKLDIDHVSQTISIHLPFTLEQEAANPEKLSKEKIESVITGKRILVVEDNKINQLVVGNLLKAHGAVVFTADDGLAGVEQMQNNVIDLVLMDIQLPKLDGYRATAEIRKMKQKEKSSVAIVALTASAYLTDKDKAELFQMNDHIGKPFSPEELLGKIVAILNPNQFANTSQ